MQETKIADMLENKRLLFGVLPVLLAAILWGTTGTLQTLLPSSKDPYVVGAFRMLFGAATLLIVACLYPHTRKGFARLPMMKIIGAGIAIGAYNMLFFAGVLQAGVGIGTAITIGSAPIWVTLIMFARFATLPSRRQVFGQALCIFGAVLLVLPQGQVAVPLIGVALALGSGLCYALYSLISSEVSSDIPSNTQAAATFGVAAVVTFPVLVMLPVEWAFAPQALSTLIALGVVATGLSYALYTWGLRSVTASTAVTLALAEPLTAWILATTVVGERVTLVSGLGALSLFVGIAIVSLARR